MTSLGCPKNQVDAEQMLGVLTRAGFEITPDHAQADVIIVNTCGFIQSAKEESIEAILDAAEIKSSGNCKKLVVSGCLAQRYKNELMHEFPEVDAIIGIAEIRRIDEILKTVLSGSRKVLDVSAPTMVCGLPRRSTTPLHYRYLKIADGCSNRCSYCAIPIIRGDFMSRPHGSILEEAARLADEGAKELVLVAQDSTGYSDEGMNLPLLLRKLVKVPGIEWVRLMYAHPNKIDQDLIHCIAEEEKICNYLDLPIQHIDANVLSAMSRKGTPDNIQHTLDELRTQVPDIALRTSLLVGFPGETEPAFKRLLLFVKEVEFEHLGVFAYSSEEGTPAYDLEMTVSEEIAQERLNLIMEAQAKISLKKTRALIGSRQRVLVDAMNDMVLHGRTQYQAPEIDGLVYLSEVDAEPGQFVDVVISDAREYDLVGTDKSKTKSQISNNK